MYNRPNFSQNSDVMNPGCVYNFLKLSACVTTEMTSLANDSRLFRFFKSNMEV